MTRKFPYPTTAFFECQNCDYQWYDFDLGEEKKKIVQCCLECRTMVHPFLIKDRCFGNFNCKECKKQWFSAYAYAKTFQKCRECKGEVYPHRMSPLEGHRHFKKGDKKEHLKKLCGRCIKIGYKCCSSAVEEDISSLVANINNMRI